MYQLLPVLLDGLSPDEQRSLLERLDVSVGGAAGAVARVDRSPSAPGPAPAGPRPTRAPARTTYRRRHTPAELDAIAAAPWRGRS